MRNSNPMKPLQVFLSILTNAILALPDPDGLSGH